MSVIIDESKIGETSIVNKIIKGNALTVLKKLPSNFVDCVITSPPYWGKREYKAVVEWLDGTKCELGLEPIPELYVKHLIQIFREIKRVLKPHGNVFVVIDDTYSGSNKGYNWVDPMNPKARNGKLDPKQFRSDIPRKSLCLVPERFAIRMVDELGFILRNKIVWSKKVYLYKDRTTIGNAMPESVKDRLCHAWEYVFHFTKEPKYWYDLDAVRVPHKSIEELRYRKILDNKGEYEVRPDLCRSRDEYYHPLGANPGDVVQINTEPFPEAHFAVFPTKLVELLIKLGCPEQICSVCGNPREKIYERLSKTGDVKPISGKYKISNEFNHSVGAREHYYTTIRRFILPKSMQVAFARWLRRYISGREEHLDEIFGEHKWRHWVRTDNSGASLPGPEDYVKLKQICNLPDTWDKWLLETITTLVDDKANSCRIYGWSEYCRCGSNSWNSGIVLDPFLGSGTTALVALKMGRNFIGIEMVEEYCNIAYNRIKPYIGQTTLIH